MADHRYGSSRSPDPPIWNSPGFRDMGGFGCCFLGCSVPRKAATKPTIVAKTRKSHIGGSGDRLEPYRWSSIRVGLVSAEPHGSLCQSPPPGPWARPEGPKLGQKAKVFDLLPPSPIGPLQGPFKRVGSVSAFFFKMFFILLFNFYFPRSCVASFIYLVLGGLPVDRSARRKGPIVLVRHYGS
jgi:hypothetical protein